MMNVPAFIPLGYEIEKASPRIEPLQSSTRFHHDSHCVRAEISPEHSDNFFRTLEEAFVDDPLNVYLNAVCELG